MVSSRKSDRSRVLKEQLAAWKARAKELEEAAKPTFGGGPSSKSGGKYKVAPMPVEELEIPESSGVTEADLRATFDKLDVDGNGALTKEELLSALGGDDI